MRIIAYTYEADFHCVDCTFKRFNVQYDSELDLVEDSEGNAIHPVFDIDELNEDEVCGGCFTEIN